MSATFELKAKLRSDLGKCASRRLRKIGKIPAIVYGNDMPNQPIIVNDIEVINKLNNQAFYSHVLILDLDGHKENVILRDLQRHPFKPTILHMDFLRVRADRRLSVHVPIHFINEENARGVKHQGGVVNRTLIDIELSCFPKDLPEYIEIDIVNLGIGEAIHLTDIKLPDGVELANHILPRSEQDSIIVSIQHARIDETDQSNTDVQTS